MKSSQPISFQLQSTDNQKCFFAFFVGMQFRYYWLYIYSLIHEFNIFQWNYFGIANWNTCGKSCMQDKIGERWMVYAFCCYMFLPYSPSCSVHLLISLRCFSLSLYSLSISLLRIHTNKAQQLSECRWWFLLLSVEYSRPLCNFHFSMLDPTVWFSFPLIKYVILALKRSIFFTLCLLLSVFTPHCVMIFCKQLFKAE